MSKHDINPFDILSGKVVQSKWGTFCFKEAGRNTDAIGWPTEGELHRDDDLPAAIWYNGDKEWYKNGELHRDNDLPAIMDKCGNEYWYKDGVLYTPKRNKL